MNSLKQALTHYFCDPETGDGLNDIESWLLSGDEVLFPILCDTPILQPQVEAFLEDELWQIARAIAEYGADEDARRWYFSRYGRLSIPEPAPIDSDILGEGYPGFWDCVGYPDFLHRLKPIPPEDLILQVVEPGFNGGVGLDLGAGQGGMTQRMAALCEEVIGVELNFYLAATANHFLPRNEIPIRWFDPGEGHHADALVKPPVTNAKVICADARCLPFREAGFDWIHLGHILDLLEEPAEVLAHLRTLMNPNAWLTICTPWDFSEEGHFDELLTTLGGDFREVYSLASLPWLRYRHKRRFLLHEDWIWIGRLGNSG